MIIPACLPAHGHGTPAAHRSAPHPQAVAAARRWARSSPCTLRLFVVAHAMCTGTYFILCTLHFILCTTQIIQAVLYSIIQIIRIIHNTARPRRIIQQSTLVLYCTVLYCAVFCTTNKAHMIKMQCSIIHNNGTDSTLWMSSMANQHI